MAAVWGRYLRLLERSPLLTMSGTTCTLMATGDAVSQLVIEKTPIRQYDIVRSGRFAFIGLCLVGPTMRVWYLTLDKLYKGSKMAAIKMMATDQVLMAPVFLGTFISSMGALRGESLDSIKAKLNRDYLMILKNNYKVWPLAQFINFYFLPLQHRVLFVNFVALGWNTYLAWATEKK